MDLVIISHSGRALALSAARSHLPAHVIDCFADQDTRAHARSVRKVPQSGEGFARRQLTQALTHLAESSDDLVLLPCSGFEADPDMLTLLATLAPCLGNSADTVRRCKTPETWSALLTGLAIPHPPVSRNPDDIAPPRLIKTVGAMGGGHVRPWTQASHYAPDHQYIQAYIPGKAMSAVFIADGERHTIIGYNALFNAAAHRPQPFIFTGAITIPAMAAPISRRINAYLSQLVPALSLMGLCGVDFILDQHNQIILLEINPRPPATFELHEHTPALFDLHLHACRGTLPQPPPPITAAHNAMRILYADHNLHLTAPITWPSWSANRPDQDTHIAAGEPICTLFASAADGNTASRLLNQREKITRRQLARFHLVAYRSP